MPSTKLDLRELELLKGPQRLLAPLAKLEVSWPEGRVRLDPADRDASAWLKAVVAAPKDDSPLKPGAVWDVRGRYAGRLFLLKCLPVSAEGWATHPARGWLFVSWRFAVVRVILDPHDWTPKPRHLRTSTNDEDNILQDLAAWLKGEVETPECFKFTSEGGFTPKE